MNEVPKTLIITGTACGIGLELDGDRIAQGANRVEVGHSVLHRQDASTFLCATNPRALDKVSAQRPETISAAICDRQRNTY